MSSASATSPDVPYFEYSVRGADDFDLPFLEQMFFAAADWNPQNAHGEEHWRADPMLEKYLGGWKRHTDFGFIVEADDEPVGAVWMRYFEAADPGYGFVDELTPELTLGVLDGFRGRGLGRRLLQAAVDAAPAKLSLSVEDGNGAIRLYEQFGFLATGRVGNSTTMVREADGTTE